LVVDAGAHVGLFSLVASVFAKQVLAIEPDATNYRLLSMNLERNCIHNVAALQQAVWQHKADEIAGMFWGRRHCTVSTTTLPEIVQTYGAVDLLKMDTEGAEFSIFAAADQFVLPRINAIVAELHLRYGDPAAIAEKLRSSGFSVGLLAPPLRKRDGYSVHNLFGLKLLRNVAHWLARLGNLRDRNTLMVFASRRHAKEEKR
jgi:FkbM family methyltransferase